MCCIVLSSQSPVLPSAVGVLQPTDAPHTRRMADAPACFFADDDARNQVALPLLSESGGRETGTRGCAVVVRGTRQASFRGRYSLNPQDSGIENEARMGTENLAISTHWRMYWVRLPSRFYQIQNTKGRRILVIHVHWSVRFSELWIMNWIFSAKFPGQISLCPRQTVAVTDASLNVRACAHMCELMRRSEMLRIANVRLAE